MYCLEQINIKKKKEEKKKNHPGIANSAWKKKDS
jgi:hypothetical protein